MITRFRCTVCGKLTSGRIPRTRWWEAADLTFRYPRKHQVSGQICPGTYQEAAWQRIKELRQAVKASKQNLDSIDIVAK